MKKTITILFLTLSLISCKKNIPYQKAQGLIQGTTYSIIYQCDSDLQNEIHNELLRFDKSLSIFNPNSTISRVNRNDSTVTLDSLFLNVFYAAQKVSKNTNGAFDLTVSPLVKMWGFYKGDTLQVSQSKVDSVLNFVGYQKIQIKNGKIHKDDTRILLDANAIAQGYSADIIANFLDKKNCHNYLVEIGGEVRAKGLNNRNQKWSVGIQKPIFDTLTQNSEIQLVAHISDQSIATSGNYHKFKILNGKRYGHEINPATGWPAQENLLSATIVTDKCIYADAYATACMVMGLERSLELCKKVGIEGFFVYLDKDGNIADTCTIGFQP